MYFAANTLDEHEICMLADALYQRRDGFPTFFLQSF